MKNIKPELLSPGGSLEKAKYALDFGADAVYCGINLFALRTYKGNFNDDELENIIKYAHDKNKNVYVALNIFARNSHLKLLENALRDLSGLNPDAFIISDPGVFSIARKQAPEIPIHVSTQANVTNIESVKFWKEQGASRIILARELSLKEIKEIKDKVKNIELETFIHGAQCMAYSGRCMLSAALNNKGRANIGTCKNSCRWQYRELEELKRPGTPLPVKEDLHGTYFFNANDICMIEHMPKLINAGITSFKIEGRGRSIYYVAQITKAYRSAINLAHTRSKSYSKHIKMLKKELELSSQREFDEGFFFDTPKQTTEHGKMDPPYIFAAKLIKKIDKYTGKFLIINEIYKDEKVNVLTPDEEFEIKLNKIILASNNAEVQSAHGGKKDEILIKLPKEVKENTVIWLDKRQRK